MPKDRKFNDHEVRQIFELAIGREDSPTQSLRAADGLTLAELQEVGREIGLPPDRITQAVAEFEGIGELVPRGTSLGLPTSIGRVVPLPRSPSEREWELLVTELRTTFGGKGEVGSQGGIREWTNGRSLHAFIEPTQTGHRLRLVDSNAGVAGIVMGGFLLFFALFMLLALLSSGNEGLALALPGLFALAGGGLAAGSALTLPRWASEQERRMEQVGRNAVSLLAQPVAPDD